MSNWIKVSNQLPPYGKRVLIYGRLWSGEACAGFLHHLDYWVDVETGKIEQPITHWQELPEPPTE